MFGSRVSENQAVTAGNMIKRVETKLKPGVALQRAALGDIRNKPNIQRTNTLPLKDDQHKQLKQSASLPFRPKNLSGKENDLPEHTSALPAMLKSKKKDESIMEVDEYEEIKVEELSMAFSSQMLNVEDIDSEDHNNPQLVSAYVNDIYKYMWELEDKHCVQPNFLEGQKVTYKMRAILIDWLVQVHLRFSLLQETLYLTVAIIDRYLMTVKTTKKENLQLVGVTAMFIASKYEEMYIPEVADFAYITDKTFSSKDICKMEVHMLKTLNCYISYPLPLHFLRRNSKAGHVDAAHHTLAKYLMELTLPDYEFSHCKPSKLAAAALYLSMKIICDGSAWNETLTYYSKYTSAEIMPVVFKLAALAMKVTTSKQQAVRTKYKALKLMKISEIKDLKSPFSAVIRRYAAKATIPH